MALEDARHIVISASLGWGHLRALCTLASRFVKLRPKSTITFLTARGRYDGVVAEIARDFQDSERHLQDRIHVVALQQDDQNPMDFSVIDKAFIEQYEKLLKLEPVFCAKTEKNIAVGEGRRPDALIVDMFAHTQFTAARKIHPEIKAFAWAPSSVSGILGLLGPFGADSKGATRRAIEERMKATGEPFPTAAFNVTFVFDKGKIVEIPGVPPMYDYEIAPQEMPNHLEKIGGFLLLSGSELFHEADGVLMPTAECYEPAESVSALREFLALTNRKLHIVGPLQPESSTENAIKNELRQSPKAQETELFLQKISMTHGSKSLVYMSFGSGFWIQNDKKIWTFLDTMIEKNIPFIMAHASPWAKIPDEISAKVAASGIGLLTPWAPQQLILNHRATGWFVSHCGVNSVLEAIHARVPIIAWPISAEQSINSAHVSTGLGIAYELFEVRDGKALKVCRTGKTHSGTLEAIRAEAAATLDSAFGAGGVEKRKNIEKLYDAFEQAWTESGPARKQTIEFLAGI